MKIRNKTDWNSRGLRALFTKICKHEGFTPRIVDVVYGRRSYASAERQFSGQAYVNGSWVNLRLPNKVWEKDSLVDVMILEGKAIENLAKVFAHELGHCLGLNHREMLNYSEIDVSYLNGEVIHRDI